MDTGLVAGLMASPFGFSGTAVTEAFRAYLEIRHCLEDCPVLDEQDYCRREYEATLENFDCALSGIRHKYELPDGWKEE